MYPPYRVVGNAYLKILKRLVYSTHIHELHLLLLINIGTD